MRNIPTTAVIAVAGYGTRMLPITKSIEKCMLPVLNRPVVDYIVEDCIKSGIKRIIFITGEDHYQLQTYYGDNIKLYDYLANKGKHEELAALKKIGGGLRFTYEVQPADGRYGTAVPLELAKKHLAQQENFIYLMGDDFFAYQDMPSTKKLILDWAKNDAKHALIGAKKPDNELYRYGVIETNNDGGFKSIVEKPPQGEAPSNYVSVARYLLNKSIFDYIDNVKESQSGELHVTEAINLAVIAGEAVLVSQNDDEWLDCGNLNGWLNANNYLNTRYR